jgi:hypothetical protein
MKRMWKTCGGLTPPRRRGAEAAKTRTETPPPTGRGRRTQSARAARADCPGRSPKSDWIKDSLHSRAIGRGKRLAFSPTEKAQIASIKAKRAVGLEGGGSLSSARVQSSRAFALARDGRIPVLPFARSAFLEGFSRAYYDRGECQKLTPAIIAEVPQSRRVLA